VCFHSDHEGHCLPKLLDHPLALLIGTGTALAALAPLGKLAMQANINPFLWTGLTSLVPSLVLAFFAFRNGTAWKAFPLWKFGFVAGIFANLIPSTLLLFAVPHIGSGLAGLMFALSPVVTAVLSLILRVRPPSASLLIAVAFGFVGAVIIVAGREQLALPGASAWLLAALLIPCSLAIGNVFRTARWPKGATPLEVSVAANASVAAVQLPLAYIYGGGLDLASVLTHIDINLAQWIFSLAQMSLFFRLQWIGGPTYLSQIGYVAAAISLAVGVGLLGESYPMQVWLGAALIIAGIGASAWEALRKR
jgi:drug/metabolite transporter (DMT)-like permease